MNRGIISALMVFLLLASVGMPAVVAGAPSEVYYELHDMCIMNAHKDLGKIRFSFGIGYEGRQIAVNEDTWVIFIHAGAVTKSIIITPETSTAKLRMIRDFVNAVDECKSESDQLSISLVESLTSGLAGSCGVVKGALTDDSMCAVLGAAGIAYSIEEVHQFVLHLNSAINAQKRAEKICGGISE